MGRFSQFWEMKRGGPYEKPEEIFKCKHCGAESEPVGGWGGEPDLGKCAHGCVAKETDWNPGRVTNAFRRNYDRIRWDRP